jgi:hypothetical protein
LGHRLERNYFTLGESSTCCKQAITFKTPPDESMSAIAIFQQLYNSTQCNNVYSNLTNTVAFLRLLTASVYGQGGKQFAVLPESESHAVSTLCSRGRPTVDGGWEPTRDDIKMLESRLSRISKLRSKAGLVGFRIANPSSYYRQYVAIMVAGPKLIEDCHSLEIEMFICISCPGCKRKEVMGYWR